MYKCPECDKILKPVVQRIGSWMNEEQFDAVKAGDYYCQDCKGDRGNTGFRYYWKIELDEHFFGKQLELDL